MDLRKFNGIVYDTEIAKAILNKDKTRDPEIEYCDGWRDFKNMGIACLCAYDYPTESYRVFMEDNMAEFQALLNARDYIVGFNSIAFDDQLIGCHGLTIPGSSYDLQVEMWRASGLEPYWAGETHKGFSLDATYQANFPDRRPKSGNGADAPKDFQRGRIGSLLDYCTNDVRMTKELLDKVLAGEVLVNPKAKKTFLTLHKPKKMTEDREYD